MRFHLILIIAIPFLMLGCELETRDVSPSASPATTTSTDPLAEAVTPDPKGRKPWAFEEIDKVVLTIGARHLRDVELAENDLEIRAWGGFGLTATQGFILKRISNQWAAVYIHSEFRKPRTLKFNVRPLSEPTQSWDKAWQSLLAQGVLTLPDAETINCEAMIEDGYSYVIEVRKGSNYRTYSYDNPEAKFENRCGQADNMLNIARIISADYGADF